MMGSGIATFYVYMFKQRLASIHLMEALSFWMILPEDASLLCYSASRGANNTEHYVNIISI